MISWSCRSSKQSSWAYYAFFSYVLRSYLRGCLPFVISSAVCCLVFVCALIISLPRLLDLIVDVLKRHLWIAVQFACASHCSDCRACIASNGLLCGVVFSHQRLVFSAYWLWILCTKLLLFFDICKFLNVFLWNLWIFSYLYRTFFETILDNTRGYIEVISYPTHTYIYIVYIPWSSL